MEKLTLFQLTLFQAKKLLENNEAASYLLCLTVRLKAYIPVTYKYVQNNSELDFLLNFFFLLQLLQISRCTIVSVVSRVVIFLDKGYLYLTF